jgi:hypothetical protein
MTDAADYLESADRLCATLERIGDALVALDPKTLLETEETLSRLVTALGAQTTGQDTVAIEPLVRRGREALLRCRRLGESYSGMARVRLQLCTGVARYGPDGDYVDGGTAPSLKATA